MKKRILAVIMAFALVLSFSGILPLSAAEDPTVSVTVNDDKSITVVAKGTFVENDWVGIYIDGEAYDPNAGGVTSLLWWYLPVGENQTVSVTYPGTNEGIVVRDDNRPHLLSNGAGSPLAEGSYYAMILGGEDSETAYDERSDIVEFEISDEEEETPTQAPATEAPTEAPTEEPTQAPATETPTAEPTEEASKATAAAPTAKVTVSPSPAAATEAPADNGGNTVLWIIIGIAAVVIVAAVVVIIVMKKKKKK